MTQKTRDRILNLVDSTYRVIARCVRDGMYRESIPNERPTFDRIKASSRLNFGRLPQYCNIFKTKAQYDLFDKALYEKLRKNSILARMRERSH